MTTTITKTVLSVLLILAVGNPSLAQRTTATFGGTVEDQSHAVLPGVQVVSSMKEPRWLWSS